MSEPPYQAPQGPYQTPQPKGPYQTPQPQEPYQAPQPQGPYQASQPQAPYQDPNKPQPPYQAPPGYQGGYGTTQNQSHVIVATQQTRLITGGCRACNGGVLVDSFTVAGVILAILFFPIGILCCFLMMEKKCSNCGTVYH